jgi:hypothetical protein
MLISIGLYFIFDQFLNLFTNYDLFHAFLITPVALSKLTEAKAKRKSLSKVDRAAIQLTQEQIDIIVGCGLGDLHIRKDNRAVNGNAKLRFKQSSIHKEYINYLFKKFKNLTPQDTLKESSHLIKLTNKTYTSFYFQTYSLPCFNKFYDLFILNGEKVVPNNIAEFLTAQALAC